MKKLLFALAATGILTTASMAAERYAVKARVPFDFTVAGKEFAAGNYTFENQEVPSTLLLRNAAGKGVTFVQISPLYANSEKSEALLVFNKYGDRYFLSKILRAAGSGGLVSKGKIERELTASAPVEQVVVAAIYR